MIPHYCPNCGTRLEFSPQRPVCQKCRTDLSSITGIRSIKEKEVDKFGDMIFNFIKSYVIYELAGIMFLIILLIILFIVLIFWLL